ncbi:riboflavin biosynthesis protein RibF [Marvinbryantia formatexigens DSM 14469]|uniref:Riboflavin biosynthesis protein n=1 Tax=Marvinbryantia formatexigens DSM 14469 TaxID=478749 RepID=C6LME7_9FIRM|nr:riboflavin biosynthesis protein RibF [Marvinbryantia formatexigens]EET58208.1 riboflavin biosynthesis protein RibF [Marvinbryantia formatexigens DSM 14469]UWO25485.1 riboflavin biosynthesis protein RibF [Marvinbryantia formatexigens DSM 14469]SDG91524.1 riboflavin kinase / FMN adenylyltransferase [Marvinbryantia formatexigens]
MKYIEGFMDYTMDRDTAVTLGKFDGLHRGHQELVRRICAKKAQGLESAAVTIWPNPKAPALLTKGEKKALLKRLGVQWWIDCPFLPQISHMEPEEFVREILTKRLRAKYIAVGSDFRFGYQRRGDCALLLQMQAECGYELEVVPKECYGEREISSSYVKEALERGDMELVNNLLGYPYTVQGEVLHGRRIGRTLGMPTTNIIPSVGKLLPPNGVYASRTVIQPQAYGTEAAEEEPETLCGITNIGYKPTVGEYFRGVETYLFDYEGDLYGRMIEVQLHAYERPEQKFPDMESLKAQMQRDIEFGKEYFSERFPIIHG